jgi:hypothetical protein
MGTGSGTFQNQITFPTGTNPVGITNGDFDGDGKQDLAVINQNGSTFGVYLATCP